MRVRTLATIVGAVCVIAASAVADVEVLVGNHTTVEGEFSPADERETLRAEIPGGAVLSVRARGLPDESAPEGGDAPKSSRPVVKLELFDPAGELVKTVIGGKRGARLRTRIAISGRYRVVVSGVGETPGRYEANIAWKSPRRFRRSVQLGSGEIRVPFTADAGAIATLSISPSRGAGVRPRLIRIEADDGFIEDLLPPETEDSRTHKLTGTPLPIGGDLFLVVTDSVGETGDARVSVRVTPPPSGITQIDVDDESLGLGGEFGGENPIVTLIGPGGGRLTVAEGEGPEGLGGTSIEVPPGTISFPTSVVIAEAPALAAPAQSYAAASAAVFFGPQRDADFPQPVTLTLVYDAAAVQYPTTIRVFERLSDGSLRLVPRDSYIIDPDTHTISFPVLRLGSYQVFAPMPIGWDAGGYTARAVPFAWEDITETGTPHLDAPGFAEVDLPYAFTFYGEQFTKLYVSDDGLIAFQPFEVGTGPNEPLSGPLTVGGDQYLIAPLWDSLTLPSSNQVFSETRGDPGNRRTIIQWRGVGHADGGDGAADFEVILYEGRHEIRLQYNDVTFGVPSADFGASATVGIRAPGGDVDGRNLQWSFDMPLLDFCDAILFADYF